MANKTITRRDFLKIAAVTPLAGAVTPAFKQVGRTAPGDRVRVVLVRDKDAINASGQHIPDVVQKMLDDAVSALFEDKDPAAAWRRIVNPSDTVGIKTNFWRYLPTGEVVEQALKRRVREAGVPDDRIGIADRGVLSNPLFQNATALINARPARTHHWAGMGGCIKNMIMFVPRASDYHGDSCADLATIWNLPPVKGRTRLNVLLLLTPLFHGIGPHHFSREYVWPYRGILVGQDPVAVDATGVRILQAKRLQFFKEDRPLQPPAHHIVYADTRHHLGVSDPDHIELVKLGWQDDILV
jgi:hypothetical protein